MAGEAVQAEYEWNGRLGVVIGWEDQESRALTAQCVDDVILVQVGDQFGMGYFFAAGGEDQRQQSSKGTDFVVPHIDPPFRWRSTGPTATKAALTQFLIYGIRPIITNALGGEFALAIGAQEGGAVLVSAQ